MNAVEMTPEVAPGSGPVAYKQSLDDAIHALAQPLTALSFVLDLACMRDDAAAWRDALKTSQVECQRAIRALQEVRSAAIQEGMSAEFARKGSDNSW